MNAPQQVAAFEAVYRAEHRQLLRYLGRRVGLDDAPDLAQEAFLKQASHADGRAERDQQCPTGGGTRSANAPAENFGGLIGGLRIPIGSKSTDLLSFLSLFDSPHAGAPGRTPPRFQPVRLMIRMLIIGYCMGIRSERRLCEEVRLNLAYRWFCRLGLDGAVPDHSTFWKKGPIRVVLSRLTRDVETYLTSETLGYSCQAPYPTASPRTSNIKKRRASSRRPLEVLGEDA